MKIRFILQKQHVFPLKQQGKICCFSFFVVYIADEK